MAETKPIYNAIDRALDDLNATIDRAGEIVKTPHVSIIDDLYCQLNAARAENQALRERIALLESDMREIQC